MDFDYKDFWITDQGLFIESKTDHNEAMRDYVYKNKMIHEHTKWAQTTKSDYKDYKAFALFGLNWVRVCAGVKYEDGIAIETASTISKELYKSLKEYIDNRPTNYFMIDLAKEEDVSIENSYNILGGDCVQQVLTHFRQLVKENNAKTRCNNNK